MHNSVYTENNMYNKYTRPPIHTHNGQIHLCTYCQHSHLFYLFVVCLVPSFSLETLSGCSLVLQVDLSQSLQCPVTHDRKHPGNYAKFLLILFSLIVTVVFSSSTFSYFLFLSQVVASFQPILSSCSLEFLDCKLAFSFGRCREEESSRCFLLLTALQHLAASVLNFPISKLVPLVVGMPF